ncbi:MAG: hypothetical protein V1728_05495 [Candidatus Micrarchaeota archaeon]
MNIAIQSKKARPLLGCQEVLFELSFDAGVPSRKEVRSALCAALSIPSERLLIVRMDGSYGVHTAQGIARVYESAERLGKDKRHLRVRDGLEAKAEKKAAPKATSKAK